METTPSDLIERFYLDVWNNRDFAVAYQIIAPDFRFRGSLGPEKKGIEGFLEYVRFVHDALGDYTCVIKDLVESGDKAAARMTFQGIHQNEFFGIPATGKAIEWAGAAFFTIEDSKIARLWVLGDIDAVKQQLGAGAGVSAGG